MHELAHAKRVEEFLVLVFEMQRDRRAAQPTRGGVDGVAVFAVGAPQPRFARARSAAHHVDAIGHQERSVEADAELPDELRRPLRLLRLQLLDERARARARDGAQVLAELGLRHADATVVDGERACCAIDGDANVERGIVGHQLGLGDRAEAELVERVRRVRDQLAQEDLFVRVQRVDDEVKDLVHLGLEGVRLTHGTCVRRRRA